MHSDTLVTLIRLHIAEPDLSDNLEFYRKKYPGEYRKAAAIQGDDCGTDHEQNEFEDIGLSSVSNRRQVDSVRVYR